MNHNSVDGFENYRRERERLRRMGIGDKRPLSGPTNALSQLEAVEAREERERQLSREMQDFFESATRTAAQIVQKVAESAKVRIDQQLSGEMEEFLRDSITRMQDLVTAVLETNSGSRPEEVIEPLMHNLVGTMLDTFRSAGTAGADKHLGMDPMATNLEDVRREFQAKSPKSPVGDAQVISTPTPLGAAPAAPRPNIEEHLVAQVDPQEWPPQVDPKEELDRFEKAIDSLVRQGTMSREEARAALKARKGNKR